MLDAVLARALRTYTEPQPLLGDNALDSSQLLHLRLIAVNERIL